MTTKQELKDQLILLLDERKSLIELIEENNIIKFGYQYQSWYSKSLRVLYTLGKDRIVEFVSLYEIDPKRKSYTSVTYYLQDYIGGVVPTNDKFNHHEIAKIRLLNQFQILKSLSTRIDSVLEDVEGHLFSNLQDAELKEASSLININKRAAGALAGVILERHLQRVAIKHEIKVSKKNPTISDLNDPLKAEGIYDVPTWRKIQLFADIRNICSHQKDSEPSKEQVVELIEGVSSLIKLVF